LIECLGISVKTANEIAKALFRVTFWGGDFDSFGACIYCKGSSALCAANIL